MTKVFGTGSPEWNEARDSQIAPSGTAARNLAQTDFVGIAIHCAQGGICDVNNQAKPDPLPDEAGGYHGFKALFGAKYVNPVINHGSPPSATSPTAPRSSTSSASPASRASTACSRRAHSAKTAQMQEAGVPVTMTYISDAHDGHGVAGEIHHAYGPGKPATSSS